MDCTISNQRGRPHRRKWRSEETAVAQILSSNKAGFNGGDMRQKTGKLQLKTLHARPRLLTSGFVKRDID